MKLKILAVDDDLFILELICKIAARAGFPGVTVALSGERALEILDTSEDDFDCLMLDIQMPAMDGVELCRHVRAISAYRNVPIIMLTAMTEKRYIDSAFQAGATDYANKPLDIKQLGSRLRMAEKMTDATRRHVAVAPNFLAAGHGPSFNLSDKRHIDGIENLIRHAALGNYVAQLSRAGLAGSQVFAIKIDTIEKIYARASLDDFQYALTEAADAIRDVFKVGGYMMAYAGDGIFMLVSHDATLVPFIDFETEIQSLLDEKNTEYDNGEPLDIEISVGNPIRPSIGKVQRVQKTFECAVACAKRR